MHLRITSYNVCYTKLLRYRLKCTCNNYGNSQIKHIAFHNKRLKFINYFHTKKVKLNSNYLYVITSYSIHYTKLYDTLADNREIEAEHLILDDSQNLESLIMEELTLREYNLRLVKRLLDKYDNKPKLVADKLDIGVATIYRIV